MKKNSWVILGAVALLIVIVVFMLYDFFGGFEARRMNVYEFNLDEFDQVDSALICYEEVLSFPVGMQKPHALALDPEGNIYVGGSDSLLIFNPNGEIQQAIHQGKEVTSLAISPAGEIYVGAVDHVEVLSGNGSKKATWEIKNDRVLITSIATSGSSVFIADAGNKIVYHYNLNGEFQNEIGRKDSLQGIQGFVIPSPYFDVAMGREDEVWAVNSGRHQLEAYDPSGRLRYSWAKTSMNLDGFSGCCNPSHIAILPDGSFVTSEKGLVRVKIHRPSGEFDCVVATSDQFDKGTAGLDLAVDSQGKIFILDPKRRKIRVFQHNSL